jgi:hypothetical protein
MINSTEAWQEDSQSDSSKKIIAAEVIFASISLIFCPVNGRQLKCFVTRREGQEFSYTLH